MAEDMATYEVFYEVTCADGSVHATGYRSIVAESSLAAEQILLDKLMEDYVDDWKTMRVIAPVKAET